MRVCGLIPAPMLHLNINMLSSTLNILLFFSLIHISNTSLNGCGCDGNGGDGGGGDDVILSSVILQFSPLDNKS